MSNDKIARFQFALVAGDQPGYFAEVQMFEVVSNNIEEPGSVVYETRVFYLNQNTEAEGSLLFTVPFHCDPAICRELLRVFLEGQEYGSKNTKEVLRPSLSAEMVCSLISKIADGELLGRAEMRDLINFINRA